MRRKNIWIFLICWIVYVTAYLCRVNMSTVMPKLGVALNISNGHLGIVSCLFFVIYAVGQLINGIIGDRVSPYKFLMIALTGTVFLNLTISLTSNFYVILICWTMNGCFQSMFWGPMMRIFASAFPKERNVDISMGISTSMVTGYILSWTVLGSILLDAKWNLYFLIPAVCALPALILWAVTSFMQKDSPISPIIIKKGEFNLKNFWKIIVGERLYVVVFICVCLGLIKESVSIWAPIILIKILNFDVGSSFIILLAIPTANLGGIFLSGLIMKKYRNHTVRALILQFAVIAAGSLILFIIGYRSNVISMIALAVISAMTFGCNSILLSFIPLSYAHKNIVSTLVGVFDFSSYIGAAISAFALGVILTGDSWEMIPVIWLCMAITAIMLNRFGYKRLRSL